MNTKLAAILPLLILGACADAGEQEVDAVDPIDECVFCADGKADAHGISRESYLAYGILNVSNSASLEQLDDDVPLDVRAARGIVGSRPFEYIEQVDTVSYVGKVAFANLARYAQDNGFVPYCGDGGLESILEACDDGNNADGDGCSATCEVEATPATTFFDEQAEFIRGSAIGVSLVDANGYYLRERAFEGLAIDAAVTGILSRADGIEANATADGVVTFDELAILSKEPFLSSLFDSEKEALKGAWELFEVNTAPIQVIEYSGPSINNNAPFDATIERPGPLKVEPAEISSLSSWYTNVARRLQQLPGCNADGDVNTVQLSDIAKGLEDYRPVFTDSEASYMESIREDILERAVPSSGGDFSITMDSIPNQGGKTVELAEFDGWTFGFTYNLEMHHDAFNPDGGYEFYDHYFDANLRTEFTLNTFLKRDGVTNYYCNSYWSLCAAPFQYSGNRFMKLNGQTVHPGRVRDVVLMENFEGGKRTYNRLVQFKTTFMNMDIKEYHNHYAMARPMLADGTPLSTRKRTTQKYGSKTYNRYRLYEVSTYVNNNLKKFFPNDHDYIQSRLTVGRHEAFEGVVIDVHESGAVVAYTDQCELPMSYQNGSLESETCGNSGLSAKITFDNVGSDLVVYKWDSQQARTDLVNSNGGGIDLDRTYYIE